MVPTEPLDGAAADGRDGLDPSGARLSPDAPLGDTGRRVVDLWAWALSDLRGNTTRSRLAEYLVAVALGADGSPRVEWDAHDVTYGAVRVEVKSSAYVQAWDQARPSRIGWGGLRSRVWSPAGYAATATYNADVYVLALLETQDRDAYDALDVSRWAFWVLPRAALEARGARSLSMATARRLAGEPVRWPQLRAAVDMAAQDQSRAERADQ